VGGGGGGGGTHHTDREDAPPPTQARPESTYANVAAPHTEKSAIVLPSRFETRSRSSRGAELSRGTFTLLRRPRSRYFSCAAVTRPRTATRRATFLVFSAYARADGTSLGAKVGRPAAALAWPPTPALLWATASSVIHQPPASDRSCHLSPRARIRPKSHGQMCLTRTGTANAPRAEMIHRRSGHHSGGEQSEQNSWPPKRAKVDATAPRGCDTPAGQPNT
jgi:hypothetical protein